MKGVGVRNPQGWFRLCLGVTLVAWACVAWGAYELLRTGQEELVPSLMVGAGILPAIFAPLLALNFWWGVRVFAAMRRGDGVIGRWTVSAADLTAFVAQEAERSASGPESLNVWAPPRDVPAGGVDIRFTGDGVLAGDTFFGLSPLGIFRITSVALLREGTPAIAFGTALSQANRFGVRTSADQLRIPYPPRAEAEAARIFEHFRRVLAGETVLRPKRLPRLRLVGLVAAGIGLAATGAGVALLRARTSLAGLDPEFLIFLGVPLALFGGIVAIAAQAMMRRPRPRA